MNALLDTHAFYWWIIDDPKLSVKARAFIKSSSNQIFFSVVTAWEIAIKAKLGKIDIPWNLETDLKEQITNNGFNVVQVNLDHVLKVYSLPDVHNDPFDRLHIAQSGIEKLPIISKDKVFSQYGVELIW